MRTQFFFCLLFLSLSTSFLVAQAQNSPQAEPLTTVEFVTTTYDFATIRGGDLVSWTFKFTNTGEHPLVLSSVKSSCDCTFPSWPREAIAPGEQGEILVTFNSQNKLGERNQKVTVTANTEPAQTFLYLTGTVGDTRTTTESPEPSSSNYFYRTAESATVGPYAILMDYTTNVDAQVGDEETYSIRLRNAGTEPLLIDDISSDCDCITASWPEKAIAPNELIAIKISFTATETYGTRMHTVSFSTNSIHSVDNHTLRALVLPAGPLATMSVTEHKIDFGTVEEGAIVTRVFTFTNTGEGPLILMDAKGSCGCTVPQWPRGPIAQGETASITVEFNSKNKRGKRNQKVTLTANTAPTETFLYLTGEVIDSDDSLEEPDFDFLDQPDEEKIDPNCFVIYPNPTTETLRLDLESDQGQQATISIFSKSGQLMAQRKVAVVEQTVEFQVQHYPAGTYIAKVQIDEQAPSSRCFVVLDH